MNLEIESFFDSVEDGDEIIFYFAGHGYNTNSKTIYCRLVQQVLWIYKRIKD